MALHCTAPATARSVAAAQLQKLEAQWFFFLFLYTILYFFLLFAFFQGRVLSCRRPFFILFSSSCKNTHLWPVRA